MTEQNHESVFLKRRRRALMESAKIEKDPMKRRVLFERADRLAKQLRDSFTNRSDDRSSTIELFIRRFHGENVVSTEDW